METRELLKKVDELENALKLLKANDMVYPLREIRACLEAYFVSDDMLIDSKVALTQDYVFEKHFPDKVAHGWWPWRKTFMKDATGTIKNIHVNEGKLEYIIVFDRVITEIDYPSSKKGQFSVTKIEDCQQPPPKGGGLQEK